MPEIVRGNIDKKDGTLTVYGKISKSDKTIPQIRFEGQWLQALRFCVGDKIKLDCKGERISLQIYYERMNDSWEGYHWRMAVSLLLWL